MIHSPTLRRATLVLWALLALNAAGQNTNPSNQKPPAAQSDTGTTVLPEVSVIEKLNQVREEIVPSLGATEYNVGKERLETQSQGVNAPFNQIVLRMPGVAQGPFGQLHLRGEMSNLQYRINDVQLPEGLSGFGQQLEG